MKKKFQLDTLSIDLSRIDDGRIRMEMSSDYSDSDHKSALYVDEKRLSADVERFWKSIKTKKLQSFNLSFGEIDWYDSDTNMYDTPSISIKRGLKRAKIGYDSHGSIPKDWSLILNFIFLDTSTITPLLEVIKTALGSKLSEKAEKQLKKDFRTFLQKKAKYANWESDEEEARSSYSYY